MKWKEEWSYLGGTDPGRAGRAVARTMPTHRLAHAMAYTMPAHSDARCFKRPSEKEKMGI